MTPPIRYQMALSRQEIGKYLREIGTYAVILSDSEGTIVEGNTAFYESTGYRPQDRLPSAADLLGLDAPPHVWWEQWEAKPSYPEVAVRMLGGNRKHSAISVRALTADNAKPLYAISLFGLNPAEKLTLLQRFAGAFLADVNLGVLLFDNDFVLVDISETACRVLGVDKTAIVNRPMEDAFAAVPVDHRLVLRTVLDGAVVRNHAVSWTNRGERYELLLDASLLKDESGVTVGAYLIFKDVTNLRSLEEQVQRSDRLSMIGQIAAGAAHEIRNPLTSIRGFLQVLRTTFAGRQMDKEVNYTDIMLTEIDRINEIVSEFLLLSKRKNVLYTEVDASSVIAELLPIINGEALLHGITVHYEPAGGLPKVIADRELLKQVFLNIGKNGIEAMAEGGTLTLTERVDPAERNVLIEIRDIGPGIPNFLIDKIFDPFFTTKENGTGLGLAVCQRIVHDMGGTIRVASKGFGTTFTVCLPLP